MPLILQPHLLGGGGGGDPDPPTGSALPEIVVAAYWPQWETVRLRDLPAGYNTAFIAFAFHLGGAAGSVGWDGLYEGLDQTEFEEDIQTVRERGVSVILSIGGEAGGPFPLDDDDKVDAFVSSVQSLYTAWGGFDGIDYDIENQEIDEARYAVAARQLKALYGPDFAITMAPGGSDNQYKTLAQDLESTGELDMINIQYYDYSEASQASRRAGVMSRTVELVDDYDVDPHHIGIGTKHIGPDADRIWTISSINTCWDEVTAVYPTLRGVMTWESLVDRENGGEFATTVADHVNP